VPNCCGIPRYITPFLSQSIVGTPFIRWLVIILAELICSNSKADLVTPTPNDLTSMQWVIDDLTPGPQTLITSRATLTSQ
jgi:hypothetical protein